MKKLFIGKLSYSTTEAALRDFFSDYGPIISAKIVNDPYSGRSRGFGFIEIEDEDKADRAVNELNGKSLDGANLIVNEARSDGARPSRGFGGGNRRSSFGNDQRSGGRHRSQGGYTGNRY